MGIRRMVERVDWSDPKVIRRLKSLVAAGLTNEAIASRLGTHTKAVAEQMAANGIVRQKVRLDGRPRKDRPGGESAVP